MDKWSGSPGACSRWVCGVAPARTLKNERLVQEAPAAYKNIGDVVAVQAEAGIATPVARLRPLLTFKG
jgi:RNA-splicing ligase RtcB